MYESGYLEPHPADRRIYATSTRFTATANAAPRARVQRV